MSDPTTRSLSGWGGTTSSVAHIRSATTVEEVARIVRAAGDRGVLPRGLGRSYGDAAQNAGGCVVAPLQPAAPIELDGDRGLVRVSAGTSLDRMLRQLMPQGCTLPVLPGTRYVTVGGAIAADVHGKNHHDDGSFGQWVHDLTLVDGSGELRVLSPQLSPELFWATVGGMGLTGVITSATVRTMPIRSGRLRVRTRRFTSLAAVLHAMTDSTAQYHVAWIDAVGGAGFGRSVLDEADHETSADDLRYRGGQPLYVPKLPVNVVRPRMVRGFNEVWWRHAPRDSTRPISFGSFFHPLDAVRNWPRLYGPAGFLQWQCVVPLTAAHLVERALRRLATTSSPPCLVVLKRFGGGSPAPLSFPAPGWTVAVDIAARNGSVVEVLDELDEEVADVGGRVYLAKDARLNPRHLDAMYPDLTKWRMARDELDPRRVFVSDLARRLGLA